MTEENKQDNISFTNEQQEQINDIVSKRIAKVNEKHSREMAELNAKHQEELAAMQERAKKDVELSQMSDMEKLEARNKELEEKYKALEAEQIRSSQLRQARGIIQEKGLNLPDTLVELLTVDDNESTLKNIETVYALLEATRQSALEEAMKGQTPSSLNGNDKEETAFDRVIRKYK